MGDQQWQMQNRTLIGKRWISDQEPADAVGQMSGTPPDLGCAGDAIWPDAAQGKRTVNIDPSPRYSHVWQY